MLSTCLAARWLAAAETGPLLEAELLPLSGQGRLRATYNWFGSALNCDPEDNQPFPWLLRRLEGGGVGLSPAMPYAGMTLFASLRDDAEGHVQLQRPDDAHWIRTAGARESFRLHSEDLLVISLGAGAGRKLAVEPRACRQGPHAGYRLRATADAEPAANLWLLATRRCLQPGLPVMPAAALSSGRLMAACARAGLVPSPARVRALLDMLG